MFSDPVKIVEQCGVLPGMDIADLGSGSGHYTMAMAKALLSSGRVYAIDVQKDLLDEIRRILKPGGRAVVVDWTDSFGGIGPKQEAVVKKEKALEMFEKAGMHLDKEISAGAHHYGLL